MLRAYCIGVSLAALIGVPSFAVCRSASDVSAIAGIHCETVSLAHIDSDSAELELTISGSVSESFTAESIAFDHVTVNGIPLRVLPARGPFRFRKGQPLDLPPFSAAVSFRQVSSLDPLRRMISDEIAHVHAGLLVRLDLNPIEMLAVRARNVWMAANLEQDLPIAVPGGKIGKLAALAALTAAEPVWELGNRGREWRDRRAEFRTRAETISKSLVDIQTTFDVRSHADNLQSIESHSIGFILPSGRVLTVGEAVEPWIYSSSLAQALSRREVSLVPESVEVIVRLVSPIPGVPSQFSLRNGQLQIMNRQLKTSHVLSSAPKGIYRMALRDTPENVGLIELQGFHPLENGLALASESEQADWLPAAVFRHDSSSRLAIWVTDAQLENGRYTLREPSPDAAGSPVWLGSGAAGILQDDSSGIAVQAALRNFPSERF